jgi:hypothetical protein
MIGFRSEESQEIMDLTETYSVPEAVARVCSDMLYGSFGASKKELQTVHGTVRRALEIFAAPLPDT